MDSNDMTIVTYLIQEITGNKGGTDTTSFLWENGSIHGTIPATPQTLRGSDLFKKIKHLKPIPRFTGMMEINRQGGVVKSWAFIEGP